MYTIYIYISERVCCVVHVTATLYFCCRINSSSSFQSASLFSPNLLFHPEVLNVRIEACRVLAGSQMRGLLTQLSRRGSAHVRYVWCVKPGGRQCSVWWTVLVGSHGNHDDVIAS